MSNRELACAFGQVMACPEYWGVIGLVLAIFAGIACVLLMTSFRA
jgi:hypothetical protein